jgi:hypothetical protein
MVFRVPKNFDTPQTLSTKGFEGIKISEQGFRFCSFVPKKNKKADLTVCLFYAIIWVMFRNAGNIPKQIRQEVRTLEISPIVIDIIAYVL